MTHPYRDPPDLPRGHFRVLELYEPAMVALFRLCTADYRYERHRTAGGWRVEATTIIAPCWLEERPTLAPRRQESSAEGWVATVVVANDDGTALAV